MITNKKQISDIIYNANRTWDYNPMTRQFADEVAKEIMKCKQMEINKNLNGTRRKALNIVYKILNKILSYEFDYSTLEEKQKIIMFKDWINNQLKGKKEAE